MMHEGKNQCQRIERKEGEILLNFTDDGDGVRTIKAVKDTMIKLFLYRVKYGLLVQALSAADKREFLCMFAEELINKYEFTVRESYPINKVIKLIYEGASNYPSFR